MGLNIGAVKQKPDIQLSLLITIVSDHSKGACTSYIYVKNESIVKFPPVGKIQLFIPFGVLFCRDSSCLFDLARLGGVLENVCDKVQTVFIGTACCVCGQGCAAG